MQTYHKFITLTKKTSSRQVPASTGRPFALFSHEESRVKSCTPTEMTSPWRDGQSREKMKHYLSSLYRKTEQEYFLRSKKASCSQWQKLKMLKQECRMEFADSNIRELHSQVQSQRTAIDHTNIGMNNPEENKSDFTKNWQDDKEHFKKFTTEVFLGWTNCRGFKHYELTSFREEY